MNQGIDSLIGHRLDAYGSDPQALMERYQLTGETVDLLALQAAANTVNEAKNNMLANAETEVPNEKQALEQEVVEGSRDQILSQLGPGIRQQGDQMQRDAMQQFQQPQQPQQPQQVAMQQPQQQQPPMQQGISRVPAPNMMMAAQGGIVGYQGGGDVENAWYDEMGKQYLLGQSIPNDWITLSNSPAGTQLPFNPAGRHFADELRRMERTRRERGDRTFLEALADADGHPYLTAGDYMRDIGARRRFTKENPNFASQLKAMKEGRERVLDAQNQPKRDPAVLSETDTFLEATEILNNPKSTDEQKAFARMQLKGLEDAPMRAEMSQQVDQIRSARKGATGGGPTTPEEWEAYIERMRRETEQDQRFVNAATRTNMARGGIVGYQGGGNVGRGINMEALLDALMFAESGGDPNVVGDAGEEGAFQIMRSTANDPGYGMSPMEGSGFDPEASRKFARHYLQTMLDRYDGDIEAALIAYNAGATNADRFIAAGRDYSVLPQPTTQRHVRRILGHMEAQRGEESIRGRGVSSANLDAAERRRTLRDNQDERPYPAGRDVQLGSTSTDATQYNRGVQNALNTRRGMISPPDPAGRGVQLGSTSADATQYNRGIQNALNTRLNAADPAATLEEDVPWRGRRGPEGQADEASQIMRYLAMMQGSQNMINAADPAATLKGIDTNREFEAPRREPRENNSLAYLQNIGKQQQGRRDAFGAAFPEAEGAIARAQQERADGGIGYLRRLARKQEGKRQEGSRAARYLAMMQQNQNMVDAADPAGRRRGQEQDGTPSVDILKYLAMLQQTQNMVDAAGVPAVPDTAFNWEEEEGEEEDLQSLIAGRGFNSGGGVRGLAKEIFDPREWDWVGSEGRRRLQQEQREQELKEVEVTEGQLLEEQLLEAGIDPGIAEGGLSPILRRMGEEMPDWVGSEGRRRLQEEQRARELKEQFPGLESDRIRAIIATEVVRGELNQPGRIEDGKFVPTPSVPPTPVTVPEPEPEVVVEEEVVEDTGIKPDWNMLREWGAGGMGATTTADALGGSGRAVGAEIARQERGALEGRILTVKEAQMKIDKEIALAVSQQRITIGAQNALADLRADPQTYYARIGAVLGGISRDEVRERLQIGDPEAVAAVETVERQFMQSMMGGFGATEPISDEGVVAAATALNEGS